MDALSAIIWLWGAVLQGHVNTHVIFRILEHPEDAYDGKPRGRKEMIRNLGMLNLKKNDIFVSASGRQQSLQ